MQSCNLTTQAFLSRMPIVHLASAVYLLVGEAVLFLVQQKKRLIYLICGDTLCTGSEHHAGIFSRQHRRMSVSLFYLSLRNSQTNPAQ